MRKPRRCFPWLILPGMSMLLLAASPGTSSALEPDAQPLDKQLRPHASVDDIARQIHQQEQWRILAAEPTVEDNKTLYRFKLLNKKRGRVQVIVIDPDEPPLEQLD